MGLINDLLDSRLEDELHDLLKDFVQPEDFIDDCWRAEKVFNYTQCIKRVVSLAKEKNNAINAAKQTAKNMEQMERDLYLKINDLEKFNENLKECLYDIVHSMVTNKSVFVYKSIVCWEESPYIHVEYESYFNPHANPKQLKDYKKFLSTDEAVSFVIEKIVESLS